jgi:hypothetical protein
MLPSARPLVTAAAVLCFCFGSVLLVEGMVHNHTWDISYQYKSPDCFEKLAVTVNGEAPGPTIHATQGDTIVVTVNNKLETENTAIHWHGIRQIDTPWADGVGGVTQCPILPGETFTYTFVVDRVRNRTTLHDVYIQAHRFRGQYFISMSTERSVYVISGWHVFVPFSLRHAARGGAQRHDRRDRSRRRQGALHVRRGANRPSRRLVAQECLRSGHGSFRQALGLRW